jgi:hypothetical protein
MYSFLVLGMVPGTGIQITFNTWLYAAVIVLAGFGVIRRRRFGPQAVTVRLPLPAGNLHSRR